MGWKGQTCSITHLNPLYQGQNSCSNVLWVCMCTQGEVAHMLVWLMDTVFCFVLHGCYTDRQLCQGVHYSIVLVNYPMSLISLDDPLSHKAESPSYLSSSAWVMAYYQLHSPSHSAYFSVKEHVCQFGEAGGKWNKQASLCTPVRSTQPPTFLQLAAASFIPPLSSH